MDVTRLRLVHKDTSLAICDLPADMLILILSSLHGQDIARCAMVCHTFADLIHSDLSLQYRIVLAQNGMVDAESSALPVSEKLKRLRQYSSNFKSGGFQHEDLTAHPDYVLQQANLGWPLRTILGSERPSGALYTKDYRGDPPLYLSLFVPGTAQGGIPSNRSFYCVRDKPHLIVKRWAVDDDQDLFVMVEMTRIQNPQTNVIPDVYIHLYSLSSLKTDGMASHPAATLPSIQLHAVGSGKPTGLFELQIAGKYVILEVPVQRGVICSYLIDIYDWKTGEMVSRLDVGEVMVSIIPLDDQYLLLFPSAIMPETHPSVNIYSFSPSSGKSTAARHVCTLGLPPAPHGERITWCGARSGDRGEETTGYFRADHSRSIVVLCVRLRGPTNEDAAEEDEEEEEGPEFEYEYETYLLIHRATLAAQVRAAESIRTSSQRDIPDLSEPVPMPLSIPWAEWGPRGCLRLRLRGPHFHILSPSIPFGSRLPVVVSRSIGPENEGPFVYVFDVNPLVARSTLLGVDAARKRRPDDSDSAEGATVAEPDRDPNALPLPATAVDGVTTAVVEDIETALPGAVDPECAAVPYVAYRFPLSFSSRGTGGRQDAPVIGKVTMSMTGFTVEFPGSVEYEKRFQTWTV